jgi:hypothetical protein
MHTKIYQETVSKVKDLLKTNIEEWEDRYSSYASEIKKRKQAFNKGRTEFHQWKPLYVYTSVSGAKGAKLEYDLRFLGQSVATLKIKDDGKVLITSKDKRNEKYFGIKTKLKGSDWAGEEAKCFRKEFSVALKKGKMPKSKEHRYENSLLVEFSKTDRNTKLLCNIQPVKLSKMFFQMPTPLTASKNDIEYAKYSGGGIDILSRVKHCNNKTYLCVMELKDENKSTEPPEKAMKQAIAYAVFIACLLRSKSGNDWYKLFGYKGNVPENLDIDVAVVMPYNKDRNNDFGQALSVDGNTTLKLHALYTPENWPDNEGEFIGSLKDILSK